MREMYSKDTGKRADHIKFGKTELNRCKKGRGGLKIQEKVSSCCIITCTKTLIYSPMSSPTSDRPPGNFHSVCCKTCLQYDSDN